MRIVLLHSIQKYATRILIMAKKVYIVGGDGFARECYHNVLRMREWDRDIQFVGFLGHGGYGHTVDYKTYQHLYLGEVAEHRFAEDEYVVIGAGYPDLRRKIYNDLKAQGVRFINLLSCPLLKSVVIGEANVVVGCGELCPNVKLGNGNVLNGDVCIGHDVEMGDFNFCGPKSQLLGYVKLGNDNVIGAGSIVLAHAKIGDANKVAPLSVIYRGCRSHSYMLGNPALKVGEC